MNNLELALAGVKRAADILKTLFRIEKSYKQGDTVIFIEKDYEIIFNEDWVLKSDQLEVSVNCFHERRHVYQHHSINEEINDSKGTLYQWKNEFESYNNPLGKNEPLSDIDYLKQSIEIYAIRFAHIQMKDLFDAKTVIPEPIKHLI